jgi:hypothetical protein
MLVRSERAVPIKFFFRIDSEQAALTPFGAEPRDSVMAGWSGNRPVQNRNAPSKQTMSAGVNEE